MKELWYSYPKLGFYSEIYTKIFRQVDSINYPGKEDTNLKCKISYIMVTMDKFLMNISTYLLKDSHFLNEVMWPYHVTYDLWQVSDNLLTSFWQEVLTTHFISLSVTSQRLRQCKSDQFNKAMTTFWQPSDKLLTRQYFVCRGDRFFWGKVYSCFLWLNFIVICYFEYYCKILHG